MTFLHDLARDDIEERLEEVNRRFTSPVVIAGMPAPWNGLTGQMPLADSDRLPLTDASHDLIVDGLTLHWADDPVGRMVQARRALKPDGLFIASMFGGLTLTELRAALATAEAEIRGGLSPRVAPMGEIRDLGGLLQRAGFALPVADSIVHRVSYATPLDLMRDLRGMGETNALVARDRSFLRRDVLIRTCELYARSHGTADGRITATFEIVTLTGWAPAESQPRPLRPGSATQRLADALGTTEQPVTPRPRD